MKEIEGFPGYFACENGRIFSKVGTRIGRYLNISLSNRGYAQVILCGNKTEKRFSVHRLIAMAYIPNPENKPQVNHIDGVKINNKPENLEWCTQSENMRHAYRTGLQKPSDIQKSAVSKYMKTRVGELCSSCRKIINIKTNVVYYSLKYACEKENMSLVIIGHMLTGQQKNKSDLRYYTE